jgi:hypothetical protein
MTAGIQTFIVAVLVGGAFVYLVRDAIIHMKAIKRSSEHDVPGCGSCCDCPKPSVFADKSCVLKDRTTLHR